MRVNCEKCNTSFNLDDSLVKPTGSKVRCSKCKHVFLIYPPEPKEELPVADAEQEADLAALAGEFESSEQEDYDADAPGAESTQAAEEDGLDLSDIEKMLEAQEGPEVSEDAPEEGLSPEDTESAGDETLDLSDIEKILDEEGDSDELVEEKSDEDLVFDMGEDVEADAVEEQISPSTELDLGDLQKMFEPDEEAESSMDEAIEEEETEGLSLMPEEEDLSLEVEEAASEAPASEPEEFDLDATFKLDAEDLPAPPEDMDLEATIQMDALEGASEAPAEDALEIDSDTTHKLAPEDFPTSPEDLDLEATIQMDAPEGAFEAPAEDAQEFDFEATIAMDSEMLAAEPEELNLSMEDASEISDMDEAEALPGDDLEIEVEGDDLEIELEGDDLEIEIEGDEEDAGDMLEDALEEAVHEEELTDFGEDEDMEYPDDSVPDIPDEEDVFDEDVFDEEASDLEEDEEDQETEDDFEEVAAERASGGGLKKFFVFLAVVLIIVVLLGAALFLNYKGIIDVPYLDQVKIPFLSKQKAPQVTDSGDLNITYELGNYRFLETDKAGRIFIITGKVKNEYSAPRSFIQMSGSLSADGKTFGHTATAYCGNVISDLELSQMTAAAIRTRMGNKSGENNSNVGVKPGEERPFMIVFFDLPESVDSFELRVAGSSAGGK